MVFGEVEFGSSVNFYSAEGLLSTYEETSGLVFLFLRNR